MEMASVKDDGSSSEHELAEAMEISLLGKRKAETPSPYESEENEEGVESEEEEEGVELEEEEEDDDSNTEPEWGYNSFEGREYNDYVIPRQYSEDEREMMRCRYYNRCLIETKGFFATTEGFPRGLFSIAPLKDLEQPAMLGLTVRQACEKLASLCLERYNQDEGKNVKLDHVLRVNFNPSHMTKYYITFAARESDSQDAPLVEYQANAIWSVTHKKYPIFCRPSPAPETPPS